MFIIVHLHGSVMQDIFLKVDNLVKSFKVGDNSINAVDSLSFEINEGEFVVILGASGAGKTTLLNLIGGMDRITSGDLIVGGTNLRELTNKQLTEYRRHDIGFVFQFYNLMPNLNAIENVELAVEMCRDAYSPREILTQVGLGDRLLSFPSQLSGGEQQRVSIARAIAKNPKLLLCDEPTGALDYNTGKSILALLHERCRAENRTVIIVTHNAAIKDMADKVIYMKNGKVERVDINQSPMKIEEIEW